MAETAELLTRARAGDADAFCELAEACEGQLFRQAVALCHDATTAEDLTSETLIEAWKSLGRFNGQCRFSTWLYAILLHRYQKSVRKARSRPVLLQQDDEAMKRETLLEQMPDHHPPPGGLLAQKELSAGLREAIESLPDEHAGGSAVAVLRRSLVGRNRGSIGTAAGDGQVPAAPWAGEIEGDEIYCEPFERDGGYMNVNWLFGKCRRYQQGLSLLAVDALEPEERERVRRHLQDCRACQRGLRSCSDWGRNLPATARMSLRLKCQPRCEAGGRRPCRTLPRDATLDHGDGRAGCRAGSWHGAELGQCGR